MPDDAYVMDMLGIPLRDSLLNLKIHVQQQQYMEVENLFYNIMNYHMRSNPVLEQRGAKELLTNLFAKDEEVCILTSLPRDIAVGALVSAGLTQLLEQKLSPDRLIHPLIPSDYAPSSSKTHNNTSSINVNDLSSSLLSADVSRLKRDTRLIRCCALMRRPSYLTVLVDSNTRNLVAAKRAGINTIGIRGGCR
jgi:hypothetical protein